MSKRGYNEVEDPSIPILDHCYVEIVPSVVLTYILSFAWLDLYRLAFCLSTFLSITRSRVFWKELGKRALHRWIPSCILEEVDFFYDLRPEDPPHSWLWGLFHKESRVDNVKSLNYNITNQGCIFRRINSEECLMITTIGFTGKEFMIMRYKTTKHHDLYPDKHTFVKRYYFNFDTAVRDVLLWSNKPVIVYVEHWDNEHEKMWCGLIEDTNEEEWKEFEDFGVWVEK